MNMKFKVLLLSLAFPTLTSAVYGMNPEERNEEINVGSSQSTITSFSEEIKNEFTKEWEEISKKSINEREEFLKISIEKGVFAAKRKLGVLYATLTQPDYKKAIPLLEQAGTEGDSESWVNLGIVYLKYHEDQLLRPMKNLSQDGNVYNGEGKLHPKEEFFYLESDTQEAIKYFENARNQNWQGMTQTRIAEVKHQLGRLYLDSRPRNYKKAIPLFEEAGEEGNSDAWDDLGSIYYNPMKDPNNIYENIEKAITYFQKAVENGNVNATFNLGLLYFDQKEYQKAHNYLEMVKDKEKECPGVKYMLGEAKKKIEKVTKPTKKTWFDPKKMF